VSQDTPDFGGVARTVVACLTEVDASPAFYERGLELLRRVLLLPGVGTGLVQAGVVQASVGLLERCPRACLSVLLSLALQVLVAGRKSWYLGWAILAQCLQVLGSNHEEVLVLAVRPVLKTISASPGTAEIAVTFLGVLLSNRSTRGGASIAFRFEDGFPAFEKKSSYCEAVRAGFLRCAFNATAGHSGLVSERAVRFAQKIVSGDILTGLSQAELLEAVPFLLLFDFGDAVCAAAEIEAIRPLNSGVRFWLEAAAKRL